MKKGLLLFTLMCYMLTASSQRVDIDKYRITVQDAYFPSYDIPLSDRTYAVDFSGTEYFKEAADEIKIKNFKYDEENPNFIIKLHVNGFSYIKPSLSKRKSVKKNKEGKVISRTTYYKYNYGNSGKASFKTFTDNEYEKFVYRTPKQLKRDAEKKAKADKKKKEAEKKKKEKERAEKKEQAANPFLKDVDGDVPEDEEEIEEATDDRTPIHVKNLSYNYNRSTSESKYSKTAYSEYSRNRSSNYQDDKDKFNNRLSTASSKDLNKIFNYSKKTEKASFRITDSKKHPENKKFIQAMEALKVILGKMRYNKPNDQIETELQPIIDYFYDVADRFSPTDKRQKKVRAAALFNIAKIYYYLGNSDKMKEIGKILIHDKYRDGDGKDFIESADLVEKRNMFFKPENRYLQLKEGEVDDAEVDDGKVVEEDSDEEEESTEEESGGGK